MADYSPIPASEWQDDRWDLVRSLLHHQTTDAAPSQPEPVRLTDEELIRVYQSAYQPAWERGEHYGCHIDGLRAVLALTAPALQESVGPTPIPVSKPPSAKDCNAKGECWWFHPGDDETGDFWTLYDGGKFRGDTHWLPAHALPLPAAPEEG